MSSLFQPITNAVTNTKPQVQKYETATSSTVVITAPSGYKSQVISSYDGNRFHTFATSTPLTDADIKNMQREMYEQEKEMREMFERQEKFFQEHMKMFENFHRWY